MTSGAPLSLVDRRKGGCLTAEYFNGIKQFDDPATGTLTTKLFSGDWYVSALPGEMLVTILGSCVATCMRDPLTGIGGMNHFLLPGEEGIDVAPNQMSRYGVFAMESLINALLSAGCRRERLEVKVFGGGNVTRNSARIGSKNAAFVRHFLAREGLEIAAEDLEGDLPRRIHYYPGTGQVKLKRLHRKIDMVVVEAESRFKKLLEHKPIEGEIDLF